MHKGFDVNVLCGLLVLGEGVGIKLLSFSVVTYTQYNNCFPSLSQWTHGCDYVRCNASVQIW